MDLSNSKFLIETPNFEGILNLERLDLTGCTSLLKVHPSIGLLIMLTFLSLQNCSNLVRIDFGSVSNLSSLRVLHLSGCTKLENTPNFIEASSNLEYLDMDGCTSLSTVHESIGTLAKLGFLSLRECTNLVGIASNFNDMKSFITLDFYGCSKLGYLPLVSGVSSSSNLKSLISMDLSFCHLREVPDAVGELSCSERLNLQENKFISLPSALFKLFCLAYLNLSHCHELQSLPNLLWLFLPTSASLVGRYFTTTSGSRDHRSGLYIFDCPKLLESNSDMQIERMWVKRLVKNPNHFRCGFDVVYPYFDSHTKYFLPLCNHKYEGDSTIRINYSYMDDDWVGFVFCVVFEVNNNVHATSTSPHHSSSMQLPHPFYLSLESEYTEERFDMPLNLELNKIDGSKHRWTIYISREHCHFVKTGAHITFKAHPGLMVKEWGLCMVIKNKENKEVKFLSQDYLIIRDVEKSSNSALKIQLPYNWLVGKEDEAEISNAKGKEIALSNLGL